MKVSGITADLCYVYLSLILIGSLGSYFLQLLL